MKCPNCNEPPTGIIYNLKMSGVGFKKAMEGYTKCQHCGQILKYKRYFNTFIAFEKPFYWYTLLLLAVVAAIMFLAGNYFDSNFSPNEPSSLLIAFGFLLFPVVGFLFPFIAFAMKYIIFEISSEEELHAAPEPDKEYQLMFINFFILALAGGILVFYLLNKYVTNLFLFLGVSLIYATVIFGTGFRIMQKSNPDSESEESEMGQTSNVFD